LPFLKTLLARDADLPAALDLLGEAHFDMGNFDEARRCFLKSVQVSADEAGTKWMFLGQLSHGEEALGFYSRGIALLEREASQDALRKSQLASAHVSVAELFMSDLCMRDDAEQRCERACAEAQRLDPESLEALQVTASMRISQSRIADAQALMCRVAAKLDALEHDQPYAFRVSTARLLVELDELALALGVLERLVSEDDEVAEVWMLLGLVHQEQDKAAALECYERALETLNGLAQVDDEFDSMAERVRELMSALEPPAPAPAARKKTRKQG